MEPFRVLALFFWAVLPPLLPAQQPFILTDGTPVRVRLNRNLSSAEVKVGDPVDFDVVEDILVNGAVVIQRGSKVLATVTDAAPKARLGKAGRLTVNIDHARSVQGELIALRAVKEHQKSDTAANSSAIDVAASIVTAPLFLFMRGKDSTIPKGAEITAYVRGDVRLDEARIRALPINAGNVREADPPVAASQALQPASTAAPPNANAPAPQAQPATELAPASPAPAAPPAAPPSTPRPSGMTNAEVLALREAGFSDDLIVAKIRSSRCAFRMETSDMIELKKAGLSDRVIGAMMDKLK